MEGTHRSEAEAVVNLKKGGSRSLRNMGARRGGSVAVEWLRSGRGACVVVRGQHTTKLLIHGRGGRKAGCDDVDVQEVMEEARLRQVCYGVNATGAHRKICELDQTFSSKLQVSKSWPRQTFTYCHPIKPLHTNFSSLCRHVKTTTKMGGNKCMAPRPCPERVGFATRVHHLLTFLV